MYYTLIRNDDCGIAPVSAGSDDITEIDIVYCETIIAVNIYTSIPKATSTEYI